MHMSQPNQTNPSPDDLLADFTNRVLDGEMSVPASPADAELRGLKETILRLKRTIPREAPDEKLLKRMQADFKERTRQAGVSTSSVWQLLRPRQRLTLAFVGIALVAILIAFPFLPLSTDPIQGTAGFQAQDVILLAGLGCVVVLLIWVGRRK
jgi:hypothetical protein